MHTKLKLIVKNEELIAHRPPHEAGIINSVNLKLIYSFERRFL